MIRLALTSLGVLAFLWVCVSVAGDPALPEAVNAYLEQLEETLP